MNKWEQDRELGIIPTERVVEGDYKQLSEKEAVKRFLGKKIVGAIPVYDSEMCCGMFLTLDDEAGKKSCVAFDLAEDWSEKRGNFSYIVFNDFTEDEHE